MGNGGATPGLKPSARVICVFCRPPHPIHDVQPHTPGPGQCGFPYARGSGQEKVSVFFDKASGSQISNSLGRKDRHIKLKIKISVVRQAGNLSRFKAIDMSLESISNLPTEIPSPPRGAITSRDVKGLRIRSREQRVGCRQRNPSSESVGVGSGPYTAG